MKDRRVQLKVKIKSLALEASVIRQEERKAKARGDMRLLWQLQEHRRGVVREESRNAQLSYHLVRHKPYNKFPEANGRKPLPPTLFMQTQRFGPVRMEDESEIDFKKRKLEWEIYVTHSLDSHDEDIRLRRLEYNQKAPERAERRRVKRERGHRTHAEYLASLDKEFIDNIPEHVQKVAEALGAEPVAEADMTPREGMMDGIARAFGLR